MEFTEKGRGGCCASYIENKSCSSILDSITVQNALSTITIISYDFDSLTNKLMEKKKQEA